MGVRELWSYLAPICEKKSLWELHGQTVAIDLSCWICDSQSNSTAALKPYIRNLFFRTSCILMLGICPIFVLDGEAPDIKRNEIRRRMNAVHESGINRKIKRSRLNGIVLQCRKLLEALGVCAVPSPGEAEAMCARLNGDMVVDGCITQDSDCFLYGAKRVYRNFSAACSGKGAGFAVDSYDMLRIQELIGFDREGLVALALLCGCDYQDSCQNGSRGVTGIGIETASQLVIGISKMFGSVLSRLRSWKNDSYYCKLEEEVVAVESGPTCILCGHRGKLGSHDRVGCKSCGSKEGCKINKEPPKGNSLLSMSVEKRKLLVLELKVRAKAMVSPGFPSQAIIDEFLASVPYPVPLKRSDISWSQPNLTDFLDIAEEYLGWPRDYSLFKFLPLFTRWKVMQERKLQVAINPHDVKPSTIKRKRISKGVHCFEVVWNIVPEILGTNVFSTLEPMYLFEKAYPSLAQEFHGKQSIGQEKLKNGCGGKSKITNKASKECSCSRSKNGHICQFFDKKSNDNSSSKIGGIHCNYQPSTIDGVSSTLENASFKNHNSYSSDEEHVSDLDDDFDPLELSAIINGIVEGKFSSYKEYGCIRRKSEHVTDCKPLLSQEEPIKRTEGSTAETHVINEDMNILCQQFELVDLEKITERDKANENSADDLFTVTPDMKGQSFEPNFDLGTSALLQSP